MPRSIDIQDVLALLDPDEVTAVNAECSAAGEAEFEVQDAAWLLQWLSRHRTPFIKMAADVGAMLTSLEASVRGNIHFVVLPDQATELALDFGPQMRAATATALRISVLDREVAGKLDKARRSVSQLDREFRPKWVTRTDTTGRHLKEMAARTPDPGERARREMQARLFERRKLEFNPADAAGMERVASAAEELKLLGERLLLGETASQEPKRKTSDARDKLLADLRDMANSTAIKQREARATSSRSYPLAPRALPDSQYHSVIGNIAALKAVLLAGSDAEDANGALFDFFNLEFWKQRWRLYELWSLARLIAWFFRLGGEPSDTSRIVDGRWSLKFSRDSTPALTFLWAGEQFDLFYQYFDAAGERANMPDLAIKLRRGPFVFVLDPKHGESYSRRDMNEVCLRYASAFAPAASCVFNYFPREEPIDRLAVDPSCVVLYGVQPDTKLLLMLENEFTGALRVALGSRNILCHEVVALFDISPSTSGVRDELWDRVRAAVKERLLELSPSSRLLMFGNTIVAERDLRDCLGDTLNPRVEAQGTDLNGALSAAVERFENESSQGEIWLFTDGQGELTVETWSARLKGAGVRLRVWEAVSIGSASKLSELVAAAGGEYRTVPDARSY
ncbi:MAG TPA: vWA domain-containing protein [Bradyrhizobium sp.]|jgi:hypothetical protein|nr:vWA domain-containing protein [Bradyrhizobium sp.]